MNFDFSVSDVVIAAIGLYGAGMTFHQNRKINPMHKQLTVNHHSSEEPTVKDELSDIKKAQAYTLELFNRHIEEHKK